MGFFDWFKRRKPQPLQVEKPQQPSQPQQPSLPQETVQPQRPVSKFSHDKAEWYWDDARESYIAQHNVDEDWETTEEDEDIIWSYAGLHMEFFLTWVIKRGLISDFHMENASEKVAAVVNEEMTGHRFFVEQCDCTLTLDDLTEQLYGFMDIYYEVYLEEFPNWLKHVQHKPALGTAFDWADYHAFEPVLDAAYRKYLEQNHE